MSLFIVLITAVSLSMDAFSLSLIYGTLNLSTKKEHIISISVGIFHFLMPIFGMILTNNLLKGIFMRSKPITGIIFIGLGIEMLLSVNSKEKVKELNSIISIILFSFSVSIDSFLIGTSLALNNVNTIVSLIIFMLTSSLLTFIGLKIGKKINRIIGKISIIIGSIILIILGIFYLK